MTSAQSPGGLGEITKQLSAVREAIDVEARAANRASPTLVAVSKRVPTSSIRQAYAAGQRDFGENLAPEMATKMEEMADLDGVRWHFLGRIQTNKAKLIVRADMIHGVGSARHAIALDDAAAKIGKTTLPYFLQINIGDESQKNGISPSTTLDIVHELMPLNVLTLNGLMCVPPVGESVQRFKEMRALAAQLEVELGRPIALSMGMSADFPAAIECGATHVRVGTAIFGARPTNFRTSTDGDTAARGKHE